MLTVTYSSRLTVVPKSCMLNNRQKRKVLKRMSPYISMEFQNERFVNEPEAKPENEEFEIKFRKHPIYDLYYGSKCGRFIHIRRGVINIGHKNNDGYLMCMIRAEGGKQKSYLMCIASYGSATMVLYQKEWRLTALTISKTIIDYKIYNL